MIWIIGRVKRELVVVKIYITCHHQKTGQTEQIVNRLTDQIWIFINYHRVLLGWVWMFLLLTYWGMVELITSREAIILNHSHLTIIISRKLYYKMWYCNNNTINCHHNLQVCQAWETTQLIVGFQVFNHSQILLISNHLTSKE
jgi:hypothetical protein